MGHTFGSPFVGRLDELAILERAIADARTDGAWVVLVGGDAGVGKSRLIREAITRGPSDLHALSGGCFGVDGTLAPFAPVTQALRRLVRETEPARWPALLGWTRTELAALLPELQERPSTSVPISTGTDPGPAGQARLFGALLGLLDRLGRDRPTVLVLEDVHWADRSTLDLIAYLAHGLGDERVVLVITYRSDELTSRVALRSLVARLEHLDRVDRIDLGPLSTADVVEMAQGLHLPASDLGLLDGIVERAAGNPFYIEELMAASADGPAVPRALRDLLESRLEPVSRRTRRVLEVASIVGGGVEPALLRHVSGFSKSAVDAGLHEALDRGLLVRTEGGSERFEFRHTLLADTIRSRLLAEESSDLHRAVATWLQRRLSADAAPDTGLLSSIAQHWDASGDVMQALPWLVKAGAAAEKAYGWAEAERLFGRALVIADVGSEPAGSIDRADIAARASEAAFKAGRYEKAAQMARSALAALDPTVDAARTAHEYARLACFLMWTRQPVDALHAADAGVAAAPADPPSRELAEALSWRATTHQAAFRHVEARADASLALTIARDVGDIVIEGRVLCVLGAIHLREGAIDEGRVELEETRRLAIDGDAPHLAARADFNLSAGLAAAGRYEDAVAYGRRGLERSITSGLDRAIGDAIVYWLAYSLMRLGLTDEAHVEMSRVLAATRDLVQQREARALDGWILVRAGRPVEADARLALEWPVSEHHPGDTARFLLARAEADLVSGRYVEAAAVARRAETDVIPDLHTSRAILALTGVVASLAVERTADAESFMAGLREIVARCRRHPMACRANNIVWSRLGDLELDRRAGHTTPRRWRAVVDALAGSSEPYWSAHAQLRLAESLPRTTVGRSEAALLLGRASSSASRLAAVRLLGDIASLGHRLGLELDSDGAGVVATDAVVFAGRHAGLTAREREVLDCLAGGLSDAQIAHRLAMAKGTASVHVMNIKQKLGATSRVEAVVRAIQDGLVTVDAE